MTWYDGMTLCSCVPDCSRAGADILELQDLHTTEAACAAVQHLGKGEMLEVVRCLTKVSFLVKRTARTRLTFWRFCASLYVTAKRAFSDGNFANTSISLEGMPRRLTRVCSTAESNSDIGSPG